MSFILSTVHPDGVVMAADSANSMVKFWNKDDINNPNNVISSRIITRSMPKLHVMRNNKIAISQSHQSVSPKLGKSLSPFISDFCENTEFDNPAWAAKELLNNIRKIDPDIGITFHVGGYNPDGLIPYPSLWAVNVEDNAVVPCNPEGENAILLAAANDYFLQYAKPILDNMENLSLQDVIDMTLFAMDLSIKIDRFTKLEEHICYPVDVLVIKAGGVQWVQCKELKGE
jgi:hypothetical protein